MRIQPIGPVTAYRTFQVSRPLSSHWRRATCEEVQCSNFLNGWRTYIDVTTDLGKEQADYIRRHSGRSFTEETATDGRTAFTFAAGQACFAADGHRTPLEREGIYIARGGDWRGNPTGEKRVHARPADWVEEFAEHQDWLTTLKERG